MAVIGKNILENLTTGMYTNAKVCYREYIQNACDQIDLAVEQGIISLENAMVDIDINVKDKYIKIHDNATGVKEANFVADLGDIANSNKIAGKQKGFRGIGRLCGLAYCKTLKFTTSYLGENIKSIMVCDAEKMRTMLSDAQKYTIDEVLNEIISFKTEKEDVDKHYFDVELIGVVDTAKDLLNEDDVYDYLSFVAPVDYDNKFFNRSEIYEFVKVNQLRLDRYRIFVNGSDLFKKYNANLKESGDLQKKYDEITRLEFKKFYDKNGELLAWMWYGLSRFEKAIPACNKMRGLRLRKENIQIGGDKTLNGLFAESRGNQYFVGEVFAVHKELIPNSQRDYFNQNIYREYFEQELKKYFKEVLQKLYYDANRLKNNYKKIQELNNKVTNYNKNIKEENFISEEAKSEALKDIAKARQDAEKAEKEINKFQEKNETTAFNIVRDNISKRFDGVLSKTRADVVDEKPKCTGRDAYIVNTFSKLGKKERKHIQTVLTIITEVAPKDVAEEILTRIKDAFK